MVVGGRWAVGGCVFPADGRRTFGNVFLKRAPIVGDITIIVDGSSLDKLTRTREGQN